MSAGQRQTARPAIILLHQRIVLNTRAIQAKTKDALVAAVVSRNSSSTTDTPSRQRYNIWIERVTTQIPAFRRPYEFQALKGVIDVPSAVAPTRPLLSTPQAEQRCAWLVMHTIFRRMEWQMDHNLTISDIHAIIVSDAPNYRISFVGTL